MNREQMIKCLEEGENPIDVSLKKWIDISKVSSKNNLRARHQFDNGKDNCALCHAYKDCDGCPVFLKYGVKCDESKDENDKKYKKDFYKQYRDTGNAQIVIDMLNNLKETK